MLCSGYYYGKLMSIEKIDEWVKVNMFQQIKQYTKDGYESEREINE